MKHLPVLSLIISLWFADCVKAQTPLAQTPPMGWNSFDSYGIYLHEKAAFENLRQLAKKYKKHGYEYFVVDGGWFGEYRLRPGSMLPAGKEPSDVHINEYGLLQPSKTYFPNGFKALIEECHRLGLKFGLHLMRGIPRKAFDLNTPVEGTGYRARDIADTVNICPWSPGNYGVDMSKPGAQEFYNSLIGQMAEWGVDFIKVDDIVPHPKEVEAVANAIARCGRPIMLSLSPGDLVRDEDLPLLERGNMLRVTPDIWDTQRGIDHCFKAWKRWQGKEKPGFWIDMDMIPFGKLQLMTPPNETKSQQATLLTGMGMERWSRLTGAQKRTFITMRALAASPLIIGGDLPTMDDFSYGLLTNREMLAANQNGVMGKLIYEKDGIEIWKTAQKGTNNGWIGIFNRNSEPKSYQPSLKDLGLDGAGKYRIKNVWLKNKKTDLKNELRMEGNDVVFIRYDAVP